MVNAGLGNEGVESIIERIKSYPQGNFAGFPLNISVAKTNSPAACSEIEAIADDLTSPRPSAFDYAKLNQVDNSH